MRVRWSTNAADHLEEIHSYIAARNAEAATRVAKSLWDACLSLSGHPHLGRVSTRPSVRELTVAGLPYKVYYEIQRDEIWILGIRHTSREPVH